MLISKPPTSSEYDLLLRPITFRTDLAEFAHAVDTVVAETNRVQSLPPRPSQRSARCTSPTNRATTPAVPIAPADPKAVASYEWDFTPAVRKGFSCKENYVAYRVAVLTGRLTLHGPAFESRF